MYAQLQQKQQGLAQERQLAWLQKVLTNFQMTNELSLRHNACFSRVAYAALAGALVRATYHNNAVAVHRTYQF